MSACSSTILLSSDIWPSCPLTGDIDLANEPGMGAACTRAQDESSQLANSGAWVC